ncbi:MAG: uracil-DNA glycosylase [Candidatus Poribacteria bacterium]|nr:uracil-DNA glycosylase [Candidatus Poribacteria bacterium]
MESISTCYTQMQRLKKQTRVCTDCALAKTRVNVVCGSGDVNAKLVLVGEGPSAADNHTGFPFSGPAGNMLDEVLVAGGLIRSEIWLTNIIKCRAVGSQDGELKNRSPKASEIKACSKWLDSELTLMQPSVILCLGAPAAKTLIHSRFRMTEERGVWFTDTRYAPFAMATFNPAYVLRQKGDNFWTTRRTIIDDIGEAKRKLHEAKDIPKLTLF